MAELDDALLDDDIASLPDINDEETELDFDNDDTTSSTQENSSEQLSCGLQSSLEDILDMTDLDACEENENKVVNLESESIDNEIVKQENISCSISSTSNEHEDESHDENIISSDETTSLPDNSRSESRFKTVEQCEPSVQNNQSFHVIDSEYQLHQSSRIEYGLYNFDRVSNENHPYIQPANETFGPTVYQPCYDFQDQSINVGLNTSFFNEPPVPGTYPIDNFANQSYFWHNPNSYSNYGCQPTMARYFYHSAYQSPPFTNQVFPSPQTIEMLHGHVPMVTNTCQPFLADLNRYSQNISSDYLDPIRSNRSASESPELPQYVVNPLYKQNYSNKPKVLINRHFGQTGDRREYFLNDEFRKSDLFLRKIAPQKLHNQQRKNLSQSINNMDPYSYFSDIWQTKDGNRTSRCTFKRSLSPEVLSNTFIRDNQNRGFQKKRHQQAQKRTKTCITKSSCSTAKKASNTRKMNVNLKRNCKKKQKNNVLRTESIGHSNNTLTSAEKEIADLKTKKEEKMDPEMIEYCKKIEEQKRRRNEFLQIKETRRKLLAMEKIGIKKEPIADELPYRR